MKSLRIAVNILLFKQERNIKYTSRTTAVNINNIKNSDNKFLKKSCGRFLGGINYDYR